MIALFPDLNAPVLSNNQLSRIARPWGVSPLFDYATGQVVLDANNDVVLGNEAQTLAQDIRNYIITKRNTWFAYSFSGFGSDIPSLLGSNEEESLLTAYVQYAIDRFAVIDDRLDSIRNYKFEHLGLGSYVIEFEIVTKDLYAFQFRQEWGRY